MTRMERMDDMNARRKLATLALGLAMATTSATASAAPSAAARDDIRRLVVEEAARAGLSPELAMAVAKVESGFNPTALSPVGARGVMQIMPATARGEFGVGPDLLWSPAVNIRLGVAFLKMLLDYYGREEFALSHYNGGSRVGPPPHSRVIPETRDYVATVLSWKRRYEEQGGAGAVLAEFREIAPRQAVLRMEPRSPRPQRIATAPSRAPAERVAMSGGWKTFEDWEGVSRSRGNAERW
jgi:hypothetical protein